MFNESSIAVISLLLLLPGQQGAKAPLGSDGTGAVQPYELRENGRRIIGAVYTQFIRRAIASRADTAGGQALTDSRRHKSLADPAVYILLRWAPEDQNRALSQGSGKEQLRAGIVPELAPPMKPGLIEPLWSTRDLSLLEELGQQLPFGDAAIIAAFSKEALKPGRYVMAYVSLQDGRLRPGPIVSFGAR